MPVFCPHCHKMVPEQPTCAVCGKKLKVAAPLKPGQVIDDESSRQLTLWLLKWILIFFAVIVAVVVILNLILLRG